MRRAVAGAVAGLALIAAAGCEDKVEDVQTSAIAGVWRSTCDGTLTVAAGGTFTAESISPSPVSLAVKLDDSNHWLSLCFVKRKDRLAMLQYFGDPDTGDTCVFTKQ
ncbi:hypothetical protein [Dactylosporangium sp. CA-233914]|uniref:hypothetical protein n=1 Tax=Dactylosporangium sp. CA-233914 TaxID=3239934 RepID=UPI003D8BA485